MPPTVNCWSCGHTVEQIHFCDSCHSLQAPTTEYYDFFGLPHRLELDLEELERRYYALSRRLHPDVYFRRSAQEQQFSLDATAILNDAYRTLKDPVARAEYLLGQNGIGRGSGRLPAELLEEMFDWNMAMEDADQTHLDEVRARFAAMLEEATGELAARFHEYDVTGSREALQSVRALLDRRRYIERLLEE
jgi:molecular chaperone HscB